ncbi:hypothetical protein CL621_04275 [archaeon]|nr:hypothetical protein [archaeon]|tara:strand:+ start:1086 stop:1535 length:450 start_codon:yes stop_codon:yes gene_type:complete
MFDSFFNTVLGPLIEWSPLGTIVIVSFALTSLITLVYKLMTDQELMKSLKAEIKGFQQEMKEHKEDKEKMMELQKRAMEKNMKYMKHSMKPTLITFVPVIIIFGWLRTTFESIGKIMIPIVSVNLSWFWIYLVCSIVFSIVLRKILKVN